MRICTTDAIITFLILSLVLFDSCVFSFSAPKAATQPKPSITTLSASTTTPTIKQQQQQPPHPIWDNPSHLSTLPDPPPPSLLPYIRKFPYKGGFEPGRDNISPYVPKITFGSIPSDLVGTLVSNSAGRIRIQETQYKHWFDGDGYLSSIALNGEKNVAFFTAKYVHSKRFNAQQEVMKKFKKNEKKPPLATPGAWTLGKNGKWYENMFTFPTTPLNTAVMWLPPDSNNNGDDKTPRLYALCEGGQPLQLNPSTLEPLFSPPIEQPFHSDKSAASTSFFSAHYCKDHTTGDIYNHGYCIRPGFLPNQINMMRFNSRGELIQQCTSAMPFDTFVHDAALSRNCISYFLPPYLIPPEAEASYLLGKSSIGDNFMWDETKKTALHVHDRKDLKLRYKIELPEDMSMYYLVDAYDEEDEKGELSLKIRVMEHIVKNGETAASTRQKLESQFANQYRVEEERAHAKLREYSFVLQQKDDSSSDCSFKYVRDVAPTKAAPCEYPCLNPDYNPTKRRRYCWTNACSRGQGTEWVDGIQKVDMEAEEERTTKVKTFGEGSYAGPPTFIPRAGETKAEDDGYIVSTVYKSKEHRSDVVICDAATLETLCVLELRDHVPYQFHGEYVSGYLAQP